MSKQIQKIIDDRKKWMAENSIQDWTDDDTIHVAEKCIKKLTLEGLSNEEVEGMRDYIKDITQLVCRVALEAKWLSAETAAEINEYITKSQQYIKP